jgi:hypothetical protein
MPSQTFSLEYLSVDLFSIQVSGKDGSNVCSKVFLYFRTSMICGIRMTEFLMSARIINQSGEKLTPWNGLIRMYFFLWNEFFASLLTTKFKKIQIGYLSRES